MRKGQQKQKYDLVFKLLQYMNPFLTQQSNKQLLKGSINKVLPNQKQHRPPHSQSSFQNSFELSESIIPPKQNRNRDLRNDYHVYNYAIQNLSQQTERKLKQMREREEKLRIQLSDSNNSKKLRESIALVHRIVSQKFCREDPSSLYQNDTPIRTYQKTARIKTNANINTNKQQLQTVWSHHNSSNMQTSRKSLINPQISGIKNQIWQERLHKSQIFAISESYSNLSSNRKLLEYRHQLDPLRKKLTDQIREKSNKKTTPKNHLFNGEGFNFTNKSRLNNDERTNLNQCPDIKVNNIIRSKSALFGSTTKTQKKSELEIKRSQSFKKQIIQKKNSLGRRNQIQNSVSNQKINCSKLTSTTQRKMTVSYSDKMLVQAHQLDMEIVGSLLFRKMAHADSYTKSKHS